jgi:hypothetical protein
MEMLIIFLLRYVSFAECYIKSAIFGEERICVFLRTMDNGNLFVRFSHRALQIAGLCSEVHFQLGA